jgi:DNA-binding response OmpR family regulator
MEPVKPTHIFIVENDKIFVRMLDYIFSKNISYRFLDFKTGEDCLKNLTLDPALIILDYKLPGMNGYETMLEIREQNPEAYLLMLSSEQDGKLPAELLNAGADDHLLKNGHEIEKLTERIEAFLSPSQVADPVARKQRAWLSRKIYYALIALAVLLSLGYYYYLW